MGKRRDFPIFLLGGCDEGHSPSSDVFIVNHVLDVTMVTQMDT